MQMCSLWFAKIADLLPNFTKVQTASPDCNIPLHSCSPGQGARVQWKFQFPLHSCSMAGSTSAMKVSNWGGHLHFRERAFHPPMGSITGGDGKYMIPRGGVIPSEETGLTTMGKTSSRNDEKKHADRKFDKKLDFYSKVRETVALGAQKSIKKKTKLRSRQKKLKAYNLSTLAEFLPDIESSKKPTPADFKVTIMIITNDIYEQDAICVTSNNVVNASLTVELARYKELAEMRMIIKDRNVKEESLQQELHSIKMQLNSTLNHNKLIREEVSTLKQDFKQKENKLLEEFLDMKHLKEKVKDKLYKQDQSLQIVHMLCKPKSFYDEVNRVAIGYKNPFYLSKAKQIQPALYNSYEIVKTNHACALVHDSADTLEIAETTKKQMLEKMKDLECVKKKIFWSGDLLKMKAKALKEKAKSAKLITAMTVYPPNTPAKLVPKRITPTGLTEGEKGFEQTKTCYLTEVIRFFKTIKEHFEGIQKALVNEIKEMKEVIDQMEAEVDQHAVDKKCDEIKRKNLLIENENLIAACLSKDVFCTATDYVLNVSRFSDMHNAYTIAQKCITELEAENSNLT
ncbi:hypothetical protein Tco_1005996 [Tanacetum coccineum]|uniref:Uncharacterized protein n=1 Tax=Tanacetum coccineum TaxID=301880 RepID=A0ABQ5FHR4_9ASTR